MPDRYEFNFAVISETSVVSEAAVCPRQPPPVFLRVYDPERKHSVEKSRSAAAAVLTLTVLGSTVYAATTVKLIVNGKELIPMVPISFAAKALGAKVNWDARTKTVSITTERSAPT